MSADEEGKMEFEVDPEESEEDSEDDEEESDSSDDELSEEKEEQLRASVKQLRDEIAGNSLYYDGHVKLIAALRDLMELEEARQAREDMHKMYPLSPELWLDWLRDEQKVCSTTEERGHITSLFERAVKDYTNVQIWVEYVMFMLGGGDMDLTRAVCDRALTAVGTHIAEGILVWQVVLLVEKQFYAGMQKPGGVESEQDKKDKEKQLRRIQSLLRRQSRVPLLNADPQTLLEDVSEYFEGDIDPQIKSDLEKSRKKLDEKIPFEDELLKSESEAERLTIYRRYIAKVHETDNPAVVQSLYERAVTDHCLDAGLWEEYVSYVLKQFQGLDYVVLPVCERSQRNCPWSASLCVLHIRALQMFATEGDTNLNKKVKGVLEKGLSCGLQSGSEATRMWISYLVYLRRLIEWDKDHKTQLEAFRDTCQQAVDTMDQSFGVEGDIYSEIPKFLARVEAELAKNIEGARQIWNDIIMKRNDNFKNASFWLEFIDLERSFGTEKHCRKLYRRALERVWDQVELIGDSYLRFEQEVGTFETMEDFIRRYDDRMFIVRRKRSEDAAKLEAEKEGEELKFGKQNDRGRKTGKRKFGSDTETNGHLLGNDGFKTPMQVPKKAKGNSDSSLAPTSKKDSQQPPRSKSEADAPPGFKRDGAPPPGFKGDVAPPPGFKSDVAPPPGYKSDVAPPPGYKSDVAPPPGFKGDVSPPPGYKRKAEKSQGESPLKKAKIAEVYGILPDKDAADDLCTVFISNLEFSTDKEHIIPLFTCCGEVKDFRLVRDFKRRSKGYGYLVFKTQEATKKAFELDRIPFNGRPVFVSEYNPEGQTHQFKFPTKLETNKLFIRGLPFDMSHEDVKEAFLPHGEIKEMRLVCYRNGYSKGTCYIEYHNEETAEKVQKAMDGTELRGKVISVMVSNPPGKYNAGFTQSTVKETVLGGGNKGKNTPGVRKKGMFSLMPRAVSRASASSGSKEMKDTPHETKDTPDESKDTTEETKDTSVKPKSNDDFRQMLLKK